MLEEQNQKGNLYLSYLKNCGLSKIMDQLNVIEVGCSSGGTINTIKPYVKTVRGCDLDINAINFAKSTLGLNVEVAALPTELPSGKRLIIMSHVLEHVFDPLETLKNLRELLSNGDYLFLAVPGINKVANGDYKYDLRRYFHIAHVTDFTASTLENLCGEASFKAIKIDEDIHGLFVADKKLPYSKSPSDSIENINFIEETYRGKFPHL